MIRTPGTPKEIAELIKDIIKDKVVCDIGCGDGTFMMEMSKYAKKVFGMEYDHKLVLEAVNKGFEIYECDSFFMPLPKADVYYLWTRDMQGVYLKAKYEGTKGTFIFGNSIRSSTVKFFSELDAEVRELEDNFIVNGKPFWKVFITKL